MPPSKLLIIDVNLAKRLRTELMYRGRLAHWAGELVDKHLLDPELLPALADALTDGPPWVLVTGDDAMPEEHPDVIAEYRVTVATIRPWDDVETELDQEQYKREVVHRWAHSMAVQPDATVRRYSLATHRAWTSRRT